MLATAMAIEDEIQEHMISAIRWIETARAPKGKKRLSLRQMSRQAGLSETSAEQIVNRRQKSVDVTTVVKLARRWDVRIWYMLTGRGQKEPFEDTENQAVVAGLMTELERRGVVPSALPLLLPSATDPGPTAGSETSADAPSKTGTRLSTSQRKHAPNQDAASTDRKRPAGMKRKRPTGTKR